MLFPYHQYQQPLQQQQVVQQHSTNDNSLWQPITFVMVPYMEHNNQNVQSQNGVYSSPQGALCQSQPMHHYVCLPQQQSGVTQHVQDMSTNSSINSIIGTMPLDGSVMSSAQFETSFHSRSTPVFPSHGPLLSSTTSCNFSTTNIASAHSSVLGDDGSVRAKRKAQRGKCYRCGVYGHKAQDCPCDPSTEHRKQRSEVCSVHNKLRSMNCLVPVPDKPGCYVCTREGHCSILAGRRKMQMSNN